MCTSVETQKERKIGGDGVKGATLGEVVVVMWRGESVPSYLEVVIKI
jgi:hypothetical protein